MNKIFLIKDDENAWESSPYCLKVLDNDGLLPEMNFDWLSANGER